MTRFDSLVKQLTESLGFGASIARGFNRTKNLHQIPDKHKTKPFKREYRPKTKTSLAVVKNAKKQTKVRKPLNQLQATDLAKKYNANIPSQNDRKTQLGSTGITLAWRGPGQYLITKGL